MVFFTCNHCGESAKKPAVAKHYQWKCRGAPVFVSCMDCQKDFRGEEYIAHTSCITEAEKYSGKDYVPKASNNSGQRKQDSWLEIVRSILTTKEFEVSPAVRGVFQKLQSHDNVPRKKAKFQNFVTNCMRLRKDQAEEVWSVLEKALEKFKAQRPVPAVVSKPAPETNGTDAVVEQSPDEPVKKEKKKRKKAAAETNGTAMPDEDVVSKQQPDIIEDKPLRKKDRFKNFPDHVPIPDSTIVGYPDIEEPPVKKSKTYAPPETQDTTPNPDGVTSSNSFDWSENIFKVLAKNNDEISLHKLKRKVLKRYKSAHQVEEIPWKVEKTFDKKLRKSGLLVEGDVVKIHT